MKKMALGVFALALVFVASGCGDSHDSVMKDQIKAMNEMCDILEGIKDKESAEAAKPKLEKLSARMKDIEKRADKLGKPSEEKKKALEEKYKDDLGKVTLRFFGLMGKLNDPEVQSVLKDVDMKMGK